MELTEEMVITTILFKSASWARHFNPLPAGLQQVSNFLRFQFYTDQTILP